MRPTKGLALSAAASALLATAAAAEHVSGGKWTFSTDLTAAAEVPGPGDPTMSGEFTMTVNPGEKEICYVFTVDSTDPTNDVPTAAHIHPGTVTESGPALIHLVTPELGTSAEQCSDATSRQIAQLIAKPENFYVNVHTAAFGPGAIRGQFERPDH